MKFSIQREVFLKPLQSVIGVVEKRQTMVILGNLLLEVSTNELLITGTDLEVEIKGSAKLEGAVEGNVTVPARKLYDIIRSLPDGMMVSFELSEGKAILRAGKSRFRLGTMPAEQMPSIEGVQVSDRLVVPEGALKHLLDCSSFAMAQQDVRYYLNGLLLEVNADGLRAVATDGHRLACCDLPVENAAELSGRQLILPRKGVLELSRILDTEDGEVSLVFGQNHFKMEKEGLAFVSKLIDGKFPEYEGVVPSESDKIVKADRLLLNEALRRAAILSNEKYRGVKITLSENTLQLVAHNPEQEEAVEEIEVEYSGEGLSVGFNVFYVQEALNALTGDEVLLCMKDSASSCLLREIEHDKYRHVVMPLRL